MRVPLVAMVGFGLVGCMPTYDCSIWDTDDNIQMSYQEVQAWSEEEAEEKCEEENGDYWWLQCYCD
jgi:hypothetical protein